MSKPIIVTYRYTGRANNVADSRRPRRLATVTSTSNPRARATTWPRTGTTALVIAAVPAAIDTATFNV